ncbi:MAG: hypothetical protein GWO27_17545, partial [Thermoplasmata archaeon]|nr:hypothetical protein [Thermoplasmata archaeon]
MTGSILGPDPLITEESPREVPHVTTKGPTSENHPIVDDIPENPTFQTLMAEHNAQNYHGLIGSTYLSDEGKEDVSAVTIDKDGRVCVVGGTEYDDLPVTDGVYGEAFNKGVGTADAYDGFIAIFDPNLTTIEACSYFGGESRDLISDIICLDDGDILVSGFTNSIPFPTTIDAYDKSEDIGEREVFLAKFSSDLKTLKYCTFFGGTGFDTVASMEMGLDGSVYIASYSNSSDIPTTTGAYMTAKPGPTDDFDVVVAKFNRSLKELDYCTYLGGNEAEDTPLCKLDSNENLVVAFPTYSTTLDTPVGAFDREFNGTNDSYVQVLSQDGS